MGWGGGVMSVYLFFERRPVAEGHDFSWTVCGLTRFYHRLVPVLLLLCWDWVALRHPRMRVCVCGGGGHPGCCFNFHLGRGGVPLDPLPPSAQATSWGAPTALHCHGTDWLSHGDAEGPKRRMWAGGRLSRSHRLKSLPRGGLGQGASTISPSKPQPVRAPGSTNWHQCSAFTASPPPPPPHSAASACLPPPRPLSFERQDKAICGCRTLR